MTTSTPEPTATVENELVNELTDKAIAKDIGKYERMIESREDSRLTLAEEILELQAKRDTLLDEVARRAQARKSTAKPPMGEVVREELNRGQEQANDS